MCLFPLLCQVVGREKTGEHIQLPCDNSLIASWLCVFSLSSNLGTERKKMFGSVSECWFSLDVIATEGKGRSRSEITSGNQRTLAHQPSVGSQTLLPTSEAVTDHYEKRRKSPWKKTDRHLASEGWVCLSSSTFLSSSSGR